MFRQEVTVKNKSGLHARPASELAALCAGFESEIRIIKGGYVINPRSVVSIIAGGMNQGTAVTLETEGSDEELAGVSIIGFINGLED